MKKFLIWLLIIVLTCGIGAAVFFVARDVISPQTDASIETPVEPGGEEPDEPGEDEPDEPVVAWGELLGAVVDGYSPDLELENYDGFLSNSMSFVILPDQVLLTPSFYDESEDKLVYYALPNNEFCISLQILSFENGVLTADAVAVLGDNITFSLNEDGKMLVFGEEVPLFCSNIEAYQPAS